MARLKRSEGRGNPFIIYHIMHKSGYVYIMTNKKNGTLYVGVTSNILRRIQEHKNSTNKGFTQRYKLHLLVYFEKQTRITTAIQREKQIKSGSRKLKIKLIHELNPDRNDLVEHWYECME